MYGSLKPGATLALCTLLLISFLLTSIYFLPEQNPSASITNITDKLYCSKPPSAIHESRDELEAALEGASMANKTVIIAVVNRAYTKGDKPMFDIFLDGFWLGEDTRQLTNHLLIVAVDQTAFERCMFLRLHCYWLKTDGDDFVDEKVYMSEDFIKMMWLRTRFLGDVLRHGYNFIFTVSQL
ncbi:putative nucleotide-diphospho-sugar transferase [Helianthus annuus]|nr:putative nucleotide-diphospho-sugar transferase [Helianthus annuus]